jgi:FkbM family methyltransferase
MVRHRRGCLRDTERKNGPGMIRYANDSRLVFDLGMNNGDDTAFYLSRGFDVLALDANPRLCDSAKLRFATAIDERRLTIVNAAISDKNGKATFYVNLDNDHWSSLHIAWAGRDSSRCQEIRVPCITLWNLFGKFGVPHYLKVDVEGADQAVLTQLRGASLLPQYVSVEDCRFGLQFMETLAACGYDAFKLLDQSTVFQITDPATGHAFSAGSSGPFGDDLPGEWLSHTDMVALYSATVRDPKGQRLAPRTQWWDIHCTHFGRCR